MTAKKATVKKATVKKATVKKATAKKPDLNLAAKQLIDMAEKGGVEQNFFFTTTFERYGTQLAALRESKEAMQGMSDAIKRARDSHATPQEMALLRRGYTDELNSFNKTSTAANGTVRELIDVIRAFSTYSMARSAISKTPDGDDDEL